MNEMIVNCQYTELLGDYSTNMRFVLAQLVVIPKSEAYMNKQGEAVEKRRIEELKN